MDRAMGWLSAAEATVLDLAAGADRTLSSSQGAGTK